MTELDGDALALYCEAWATWKDATVKLNTGQAAIIEKAENGRESRSAYMVIQEKAYIQMRQMLAEFGLSPATRSKVQALDAPDGPDEWETL